MSISANDNPAFLMPEFSFNGILTDFHFIRPAWLLAFFALMLLIYILKKIRYYQSPWQHILPKHLAVNLLENADNTSAQNQKGQRKHLFKPVVIGSCIIVALAGPAWQKLPQPVYQLERGAVIVMDMSYSMYATDLKPNRLTRSRYKAIDLLKHVNEGDIGLIAYAGDAFVISPLTQDVNNIALLLPSLSPDIMPVNGANALAALTLADKTLKNAGHISGDIYWFTDDVDTDEVADIYQWANNNSHKLNILGVGSQAGAPIKLPDGTLLKDNKGAIVIPKLPAHKLQGITKRSRGTYRTISNDESDIKALTAHLVTGDKKQGADNETNNDRESEQAIKGDQYQEHGPWLLLIIIPLLLSYFRRGANVFVVSWLIPLSMTLLSVSYAPATYANDQSDVQSNAQTNYQEPSFWQGLWQTSNQQAQKKFEQENYAQAAQQFEDSQWKGSAHYKAGEFEQALEAFKQSDSANAFYNQGNTLAQMQKVDEAIDAYKEALKRDPDLQQAKDNLEQLEAIKKQQQQQDSGESGEDSEQQDGEQQDGEQQDGEQQDGEQGEQSQNQDGQDQQDQSQSSEQENNQGNEQGDEQSEQEQNQQGEQSEQDSDEQNEQNEQEAQQAQESEEDDEAEKQAQAEAALSQEEKEIQQKHQKIMKKVTDDPYLLLRNKMRLEYKKRRHEGTHRGETKTW